MSARIQISSHHNGYRQWYHYPCRSHYVGYRFSCQKILLEKARLRSHSSVGHGMGFLLGNPVRTGTPQLGVPRLSHTISEMTGGSACHTLSDMQKARKEEEVSLTASTAISNGCMTSGKARPAAQTVVGESPTGVKTWRLFLLTLP